MQRVDVLQKVLHRDTMHPLCKHQKVFSCSDHTCSCLDFVTAVKLHLLRTQNKSRPRRDGPDRLKSLRKLVPWLTSWRRRHMSSRRPLLTPDWYLHTDQQHSGGWDPNRAGSSRCGERSATLDCDIVARHTPACFASNYTWFCTLLLFCLTVFDLSGVVSEGYPAFCALGDCKTTQW